MKIGLITYGRLNTDSSRSIYNWMLSERLQQEDDEVESIVLPWQRYSLRLADNLAEELFERLRDASFGLLLQDELCHPSLFRLNRRLHGLVTYPIVTIVHHLHSGDSHSIWQSRFYGEIERCYLETVDGFIYGSQIAQRTVEKTLRGKRPAVVAYPAGDRLRQAITPEQIAARVHENGPLRVIFIGELSPHQELHILIDALSRLDLSTWHLTIVGSTAVDRAYARLIADQLRKKQLLGQITHTGPLDGIRLAIRYAGSHVLATPSTCQEIDTNHLEAMSFGLPILAGAADATGEIVTHGVDGILIPSGDVVDTLAEHLQTLNADREKLLAMSLAARARFDIHPTWLQSTELIYRFLHDFAEARLRQS